MGSQLRWDNPRRNYFLRVIPTNWYSIWHIFWHWHSIWHIFWHSIWHSLWRSIWHLAPAIEVRQRWDLAHAVEVRQCPLRSGARSWDPRLEEKEKEEEATLIKSRDPHLAGGEKWLWCTFQLRWSSTVAGHDTYKVMSNHLRQDLTWVNKSNLKLEKWTEIQSHLKITRVYFIFNLNHQNQHNWSSLMSGNPAFSIIAQKFRQHLPPAQGNLRKLYVMSSCLVSCRQAHHPALDSTSVGTIPSWQLVMFNLSDAHSQLQVQLTELMSTPD